MPSDITPTPYCAGILVTDEMLERWLRETDPKRFAAMSPPQFRLKAANYSEAAFFDGDHCQHIADRDEHHRLKRIRTQAQQAERRKQRRAA